MTTTLLQPQKLPPANDGHVRDSLTADERLLKQAVARCLKAQVAEVHGRLVGGMVVKGGPGSGNFGHEGRPGEIGGSGPGSMGAPEKGSVILYHGTKLGVKDAILKEGIKARVRLPDGRGSGVWMSDDLTNCTLYAREDGIIFEVRLSSLDVEEIAGNYYSSKDSNTIPPNKITAYYLYGGKGHVQRMDSWERHEVETQKGVSRLAFFIPVQIVDIGSKSLKSYPPSQAVPSSTKPWDDMVMREVRPIWFGLFKKGGDRALKEIRRFPKHARKMEVFSFVEMEASERVAVVEKGGPGSGNFGHEGRPGLVGGSGEGKNPHSVSPESVLTLQDLRTVAQMGSLPKDDDKYEYFYHAFRFRGDSDIMLQDGKEGKTWLSKDEVRDRGAGYAVVRVPKGEAQESRDFVESGLTYREWTVDKIPASDIVSIVRDVPVGSGGHGIRENELAAWAVDHQGEDTSDLPERYRGWFNIKKKSLKSTPSIVIPEWIDDPDVLDALEREMFKFAQRIDQTTADMLREELIDGMENGETISQLADRISILSDEWVEGWRSEMIARTETARAFSTGHIEAWRSTGVVERKVWVAAGDACPFCQQMDGIVVELDENFFDQGDEQSTDWKGEKLVMDHDYGDVNGPPLHPNCRCVLVAELSEEKMLVLKGGPGSGNFGHEGRPGEVGGSGPGDEVSQAQQLSLREQYLVGKYKQNGYVTMNTALRTGDTSNPYTNKDIAELTHAINRMPSPFDTDAIVYRGIPGKRMAKLFDKPEGTEIEEKGFLSASTSQQGVFSALQDIGYEPAVILDIHVSKGSRAIDMEAQRETRFSIRPQGQENEYLFAPGHKMKVKGAYDSEDGIRHIKMELDLGVQTKSLKEAAPSIIPEFERANTIGEH